MPSWSTRQLMSSSPSSLQAVATPGVAPVTASHSSESCSSHSPQDLSPGAPGVGGGAPALPSSITLKASAQFVGALNASGSSPTTPHARAHFPHSTQTSATRATPSARRLVIGLRGFAFVGKAPAAEGADAATGSTTTLVHRMSSSLHALTCPRAAYGRRGHGVDVRLARVYRTGLSSSGSPGAVFPPGLMKNETMSAMTASGMTVTQAVPTQPRPASRHAP